MGSLGNPKRSRLPLTDSGWRDFFRELDRRLKDSARAALSDHSARIRQAIEQLDAVMDRYCAQTCPQCPDPCCTALHVRYNVTDMVYLLGLAVALPLGQTREHDGAPCRYWLASGCALPRILRPYVCTWFFCEPHMKEFSQEPARFQRQLIAVLQEIRRHRAMVLQIAKPFLPPQWADEATFES